MPSQRESKLGGESECMADTRRAYVNISTSLQRNPWRRKLTRAQRDVWSDLVNPESYCGVFRYDTAEAAWYYGWPEEEIESALELFRSEGRIGRDGDFVWVIEFIEHQRYNTPGMNAAWCELTERNRHTVLAQQCYDYMPAIWEPYGTFMEPIYPTNYIKLKQTKRNESSSSVAPSRARKPADPKYIALAEELAYYIKEMVEKYDISHPGFKNKPDECARELRLLVETDKFPMESIMPALAWAWTHTWIDKITGREVRYGAVLLSIQRWRFGGKESKFAKLYQQWMNATGGDASQNDEIRRLIRLSMDRKLKVGVADA